MMMMLVMMIGIITLDKGAVNETMCREFLM